MEEKKIVSKKVMIGGAVTTAVIVATIVGFIMNRETPEQKVAKLLDLGQCAVEDYEGAGILLDDNAELLEVLEAAGQDHFIMKDTESDPVGLYIMDGEYYLYYGDYVDEVREGYSLRSCGDVCAGGGGCGRQEDGKGGRECAP